VSLPAGPRALPAVLTALVLLTGCTAERWLYTRAGATPAALDHDLGTCRRQAQRPYVFALTSARRVDQEALNLCMERKGYTVRPDR
jgi:hypothetical protein